MKDGPNASLVGRPGSRYDLATPALLLDLDVLERNLAQAADLVRNAGLRLRPHFKAHKSIEIARRQLEAGASGVCVATIGEAESIASSLPCADILLTSILSTPIQLERVVALRRIGASVTLVVDSIGQAQALSECCRNAGSEVSVLIDLDMGRERSGCPTAEDAVKLARFLNEEPRLRLAGVQVYAGQLSHIDDAGELGRAYDRFAARLAGFQKALIPSLPRPPVLSGGSTGSMALDLQSGLLSELQCGSYALMDVEYLRQNPGPDLWPFAPAVFVQSSVISANWNDHVITDAGAKRFASKYGSEPLVARGTDSRNVFHVLSDEHGWLQVPFGPAATLGARLEFIVPHCDPTINLFDTYHVVRGDTLVDIWPVDGRGR